jgi:hypothetical protein
MGPGNRSFYPTILINCNLENFITLDIFCILVGNQIFDAFLGMGYSFFTMVINIELLL